MNAIEILHDGGSFLAVCKPAGLSTQAPSGADSLESRLREQLQTRNNYVVFPHRLDRPVSGVILVALTKRAARLLSDQFASRKVHKTYVAWVNEKYAADSVLWEDWLRKIPDEARGEICDESAPGAKLAQTEIQTLRYDAETNRSLLQLSPTTGRMHQLRIQSASRGHAIVGDGLYGSGQTGVENGSETHSAQRILLHAASITFHDPKNGRKTAVQCPNDDFSLLV